MTSSSSNKTSANLTEEQLGITDEVLSLATRSVNYVRNVKADEKGELHPYDLQLILPMLARQIVAMRAIVLVLHNGEFDAAEILFRSYNEAYASLFYILDGTGKWTRQKLELYIFDYADEAYERLIMLARFNETTIDALCASEERYQRRKESYDRNRRHPREMKCKERERLGEELNRLTKEIERLADTGPNGTKEDLLLVQKFARSYLELKKIRKEIESMPRWKDIPNDEKEEAVSSSEDIRRDVRDTRVMGNSHVHVTGSALAALVRLDSNGEISYRIKKEQNVPKAFTMWRHTIIRLLLETDLVLRTYYEEYDLRDEVELLSKRIIALPRPD